MGFFSSILGTLKEFMAVTAMLYHKLFFLGFESFHFLEGVISPNGLLLFFSVVVIFIDHSSLPAPFSFQFTLICMVNFCLTPFMKVSPPFSCLVCLFLSRLWPFLLLFGFFMQHLILANLFLGVSVFFSAFCMQLVQPAKTCSL